MNDLDEKLVELILRLDTEVISEKRETAKIWLTNGWNACQFEHDIFDDVLAKSNHKLQIQLSKYLREIADYRVTLNEIAHTSHHEDCMLFVYPKKGCDCHVQMAEKSLKKYSRAEE